MSAGNAPALLRAVDEIFVLRDESPVPSFPDLALALHRLIDGMTPEGIAATESVRDELSRFLGHASATAKLLHLSDNPDCQRHAQSMTAALQRLAAVAR